MAKRTGAAGAQSQATGKNEEWVSPSKRPIWRFWDTEKEKKTGDILVGTLEGRKHWTDKADGKQRTLYIVKADDGTTYTVFGTTRLDRELETVADNSRIKITYEGKEKTSKGGDAHCFEVKVAAPR